MATRKRACRNGATNRRDSGKKFGRLDVLAERRRMGDVTKRTRRTTKAVAASMADLLAAHELSRARETDCHRVHERAWAQPGQCASRNSESVIHERADFRYSSLL